jgi:hypothetical protein
LGEQNDSDNERRVETRFPIHVPVEFTNGDVAGSGVTGNVSMSGVRIDDASAEPRAGVNLELRFSFFLGSFETAVQGRWVRPTRGGFAVQFTDLDPVQQELLHRALPVD